MHRVSKAFCAMWSCIIPNDECEGSHFNVASTYKIPNYTHALSHTVCGDHKCTELLETLFCIFISVSLPIRYEFIVIRLKGSPHQEVCEYSITTPHTPTHSLLSI